MPRFGSPQGDPIQHRSDLPRLPEMMGDYACAVSAQVMRVGQLGAVRGFLPKPRVDQAIHTVATRGFPRRLRFWRISKVPPRS